MSFFTPRAIALAIGTVLPLAVVAQAAANPNLDAQVQQLDQKIRILERKLEIEKEAAAKAAPAAAGPTIKADGKGLSISSPDFSFQFRALIQADGRWFTGDSVPTAGADTFLFRRVRPTLSGTVGKLVSYRITPEFAGGDATLIDAYVDLNLSPAVTVRAGKVKGPVGLERLQSGSALHFIERGLPTELAPNRDIGVQVQGNIGGSPLQYVLGVYNGTRDGTSAPDAGDDDGRKEVALRLFYAPNDNVGFGIAGTHGSRNGAGVAPRNYSTVDRRSGASFASGTTATGDATRISPQGYVYAGPFGVLAEYIASTQELTNGATTDDVTHSAWQVVTSLVLTGEDASYKGVTPARAFTPGGAGWGALELVARYGSLELDSDTATLGFAAATGVESIDNLGIGLNWHLTRNVKVALNYNQTDFSNFSGPDREKEKSIFTRLQLAF